MKEQIIPSFLENISKESIKKGKLPIDEILQDSLYYPASGFDGGVVKFCGKKVQSYVYCDYAAGESALLEEMDSFRGYRVLGRRSIQQQELVPNGWTMQLPPGISRSKYLEHHDVFRKPFGHWIVYEQLETFDADHGPDRLSLLYIGGEGVATYQTLYWSNRKTAKMVAIIQPGTGFGFNWTDFRKQDGPLGWVVLNNLYGKPETILHGGHGTGYDDLGWNGYVLKETIHNYYGDHGEVTVWERTI